MLGFEETYPTKVTRFIWMAVQKPLESAATSEGLRKPVQEEQSVKANKGKPFRLQRAEAVVGPHSVDGLAMIHKSSCSFALEI